MTYSPQIRPLKVNIEKSLRVTEMGGKWLIEEIIRITHSVTHESKNIISMVQILSLIHI